MNATMKKKGLGRGLEALLGGIAARHGGEDEDRHAHEGRYDGEQSRLPWVRANPLHHL